MKRSDLEKLMAIRHPGLTAADMAYCIELILGAIVDRLAEGGRAEFRGFGVFHLYQSQGRKSRNPKSGAEVLVPARGYVRFRSTMQPGLPAPANDGAKPEAALPPGMSRHGLRFGAAAPPPARA